MNSSAFPVPANLKGWLAPPMEALAIMRSSNLFGYERMGAYNPITTRRPFSEIHPDPVGCNPACPCRILECR